MTRTFACWVVAVGVLAIVSRASGQAAEGEAFDFAISDAFIQELAEKNTILFSMHLSMGGDTSNVHPLSQDCEVHIPATSSETLGWPRAVVVEPPNVCKRKPPGAPGEAWPAYLKKHVLNKDCDVVGFPRIFTEHASGSAGPTNPNHVFELHPALQFLCGDFQLDVRNFLKVYRGMRQIKPDTAASCVAGRQLFLRRNKDKSRYEFQQKGGGSCGNFAVFQSSIIPDYVRKISGGHSAIARVSADGSDPLTLKLYTYDGTPEDKLLDDIGAGHDPGRRPFLHGLFTYDYFSILKVVRSRDNTWSDVPDWTEVKFPLALVVLGERTDLSAPDE